MRTGTAINDPNGEVPAYHIYNLHADWQDVYGHPLDLRLSVQNVTDEEYYTGGVSVWTTGFTTLTFGAPRTYSVALRYRFGSE